MRDDLEDAHSRRRRAKKDGKKLGYFKEVVFSVADWQAMRDLLDILTVSFSIFFIVLIYSSLNFTSYPFIAIQDSHSRDGG